MDFHDIGPILPSEAELESAIKEFEKINWNRLSIHGIKQYVDRHLLNITGILGPWVETDYVYRTRSFKSIQSNQSIYNKATFSYPPKELCKINRANFPNQQVFYCSQSWETSIVETLDRQENIYYVSKWKIKVIDDIRGLYFFGDNVPDKVKNMVEDKILELKIEEEKLVVYRKLFKFIENQFLRVSNSSISNYKYTSYIANQLFHLSPWELKFLGYPSVQLAKPSINFAFTTNAVQEMLELEKVYMVFVNLEENDNFKCSIPKVGIFNVDLKIIEWHSTTGEDMKEFHADETVTSEK